MTDNDTQQQEKSIGTVPTKEWNNLFDMITSILDGRTSNYVVITTKGDDPNDINIHVGGGLWQAVGLLDCAKKRIRGTTS